MNDNNNFINLNIYLETRQSLLLRKGYCQENSENYNKFFLLFNTLYLRN